MKKIGDNSTTALLDSYRGVIRSRKGGWKMGRGVFCHGRNMLEDLVGRASLYQVMILNATGRFPERRLGDWFEALQICLSWPDPRIWCNQIGAIGGTMRTTAIAATSAGILSADSKIYGPRTIEKSMNFIQRALLANTSGMSPREIVIAECCRNGGVPKIVGFARPIAKGDERISAMEKVASSKGFKIGEHLSLAYQIEQILLEEFDECMNISGYVGAFLSDQKFSAEESVWLTSAIVNSGVVACYVDTLQRPPETFLPMRCDDIDYQGKPPRPVPENGD